MSIRRGYELEDIQKVLHAMLAAKTSAPWSSWTIIRGWPEADVFDHFDKPFIYVLEPFLTGTITQQGGQSGTTWDLIIGCWSDRKTGGPGEINVMGSHLLSLFRDPKDAHYTSTFTVTLGATTYTSTKLLTMGLMVLGIVGPRQIPNEDLKQFRTEFTLSLRT